LKSANISAPRTASRYFFASAVVRRGNTYAGTSLLMSWCFTVVSLGSAIMCRDHAPLNMVSQHSASLTRLSTVQ